MPRRPTLRALRVYTPLVALSFAPFVMGGVSPWLSLALSVVLLAALVGELWVRRGALVPAPLGPLALLCAWVAVSLVPLPVEIVASLSPAAAELRAFSSGLFAENPSWSPLSLSPPETWLGLQHHALFLLAFWVGASVFGKPERQRRAADALALVGVGLGAVILAHALFESPLVYGVFPSQSRLLGPFVNMNHLAALSSLACFAALAASRGAIRERGWRLVAAGVCAALVVQSGSRGGVLGLVAGLWGWAFLSLRGGWRFLLLAVSLGVAALGLGWVASSGMLADDPKVRVFADALVLAREYPLSGVGRFAFGFVFSRYQSFPEVFFVRSAESWPLSLLTEVGALGLLLWLVFLGWVALSLTRRVLSPQERWLVAGLFGLWVHEWVDFSLDTAGVGAWAALLLGSLVPGTVRKRAMTWAGVVLGSLVLLGGAWAALHPPEKPLETISGASDAASVTEAATYALSARPADGYAALAAAERLVALREPKEALRYVNRARYLIPQDPRGHVLAARALRQLGRRAQARSEYRAAIEYPVALGGRHHPEWLVEALQIAPSEADALELAPRASSAWPAFAQELAGRGRNKEARTLMQRFTWREPNQREGWFLLHRFALSLKENVLAEEAAAQLRALGDSRGVLLLAQSYEARGEKEKAAQTVAEGRARYPNDSALQLVFGKQALSQGDTAGALQAAQTVRELGEQIAESWALEGAALAAQSRYQGAAKAYQEALTFAPNSRAWRAELARVYERLGRRSAALEMYRALRSEDPAFQREIDRLLRGE